MPKMSILPGAKNVEHSDLKSTKNVNTFKHMIKKISSKIYKGGKMMYMSIINTAHPLTPDLVLLSTSPRVFFPSIKTFLSLTHLEGQLWKQGRTDLLMLSLPFYL